MFQSRSMPAIGWLLCVLSLLPTTLTAQTFAVERLNGGEPILAAGHFLAVDAPTPEADNINGPSVIRIPDWIAPAQRADSTARYYMYFAHHSGDYIRLAWARDIEGPWQLYRTGAGIAPGKRGVLDMGSNRRIGLGNGLAITSHIASPDVHIDNDGKRIVMYFHGVTRRDGTKIKEQQTYVATSPTGLDFAAGLVPYPLTGSYLRVFAYEGVLQGLTSKKFHRPRNNEAPWELTGDPDQVELDQWEGHNTRFLAFREDSAQSNTGKRTPVPQPRHLGLYLTGDTMHVFFTMKKHAPERILATAVDLTNAGWFNVAATGAPEEILRPEREWEGATLPPRPSKKGAAVQPENALRDPFVFSDDGRLYLFYAGGGEQAIGLAKLTPQLTGE